MREISLHILDVVQNSIEAEATKIEIILEENILTDTISFVVSDNGKGISKDFLDKVFDPFVTSRKTRNVGLGLSLLKENWERCDGFVNLESELGKGTCLKATFRLSHIDRPPIGNIKDTLLTIVLAHWEIDFKYKHIVEDQIFEFDTAEIKKILGESSIQVPEILRWLRDYLEHDFEGGV